MMTSTMTSTIPTEANAADITPHRVPLIVGSHRADIGLHIRSPIRIVINDHEIASPIAMYAPILYGVRKKMRARIWQILHFTQPSPKAYEVCTPNENWMT